MEKVIVLSWADNRGFVTSVERVSTKVSPILDYLQISSKCFGDTLEWSENLDFEEKLDGVLYLQSCLDHNDTGRLYCRLSSSFFDEDEREYKLFVCQVRNLYE